ncbi:dihydroflavonol-4-reductase-like [Panicum miliaceum]|uniref:Dihydroflavonol-4-reductase-like n=1 Tax=Panicum miliaceum TaxID=4540 RepID=A0A3L6T9Q9_PANMI|nr:dihydroflavonol-4-reductase-like [Panicum miliaceum]
MSRVVCCVTGAAGYIGSWLVRKLLDRGCVVHATLRNLGDGSKTGLLRGLPGAAERLVLFQADICDAASFEPAISGCEFVFLVAAPIPGDVHGSSNSKYKDADAAIVGATRTVLQLCERSKTVRRVIHTGSVVAAAPLREDGGGYKDLMDESCWTPLNLSYGYSDEGLDAYVSSKTLSEKELLRYNDLPGRAFDVVSLVCGLVGGDTALPYVPGSMQVMLSPLTGDGACHSSLKFMQAVHGAVPLVHVDDVCEAHALCMETERPAAAPVVAAGRFLCAAGHPNMRDVVEHYARRHPDLELRIAECAINKSVNFQFDPRSFSIFGEGVRVHGDTSKLLGLGFRYTYGVEEVLDGSVECARRLGVL